MGKTVFYAEFLKDTVFFHLVELYESRTFTFVSRRVFNGAERLRASGVVSEFRDLDELTTTGASEVTANANNLRGE